MEEIGISSIVSFTDLEAIRVISIMVLILISIMKPLPLRDTGARVVKPYSPLSSPIEQRRKVGSRGRRRCWLSEHILTNPSLELLSTPSDEQPEAVEQSPQLMLVLC